MRYFLTKLSAALLNYRMDVNLEDGDLETDSLKNGDFEWVGDIVGVINEILAPLLIIVIAAGSIYAVVLGVNMARADSPEKREEAKKRVINVLIGMAIIVGLILLLKLFMSTILPQFIPTEGK